MQVAYSAPDNINHLYRSIFKLKNKTELAMLGQNIYDSEWTMNAFTLTVSCVLYESMTSHAFFIARHKHIFKWTGQKGVNSVSGGKRTVHERGRERRKGDGVREKRVGEGVWKERERGRELAREKGKAKKKMRQFKVGRISKTTGCVSEPPTPISPKPLFTIYILTVA